MKTKCAVVAILIALALAFASQASAVLRPLFPIKHSAPFNGEVIVIQVRWCCGPQKSLRCITVANHSSQAWTADYWLFYKGWPLPRLHSRKGIHAR